MNSIKFLRKKLQQFLLPLEDKAKGTLPSSFHEAKITLTLNLTGTQVLENYKPAYLMNVHVKEHSKFYQIESSNITKTLTATKLKCIPGRYVSSGDKLQAKNNP